MAAHEGGERVGVGEAPTRVSRAYVGRPASQCPVVSSVPVCLKLALQYGVGGRVHPLDQGLAAPP